MDVVYNHEVYHGLAFDNESPEFRETAETDAYTQQQRNKRTSWCFQTCFFVAAALCLLLAILGIHGGRWFDIPEALQSSLIGLAFVFMVLKCLGVISQRNWQRVEKWSPFQM